MVKNVCPGVRFLSSNPGSPPNGCEILHESLHSSEPQFLVHPMGLVAIAATLPSVFARGAERATVRSAQSDTHCLPLSLLWLLRSPAGSRPSCGPSTTPGWRHGLPLCRAASAHSCPASPFPLPSLSPEAAAMGTTRKRPDACSNAVGAPGSLERGCWEKQGGRGLEPGSPPLAMWASTPGLLPPQARPGCQPLLPDRNSTPRYIQAKLASP